MGKDNELLTSVKEGNVQNVRKILQKYRKGHKKNAHKKSAINNPDCDGFTVLHHAALFGDVEVVMAIIEMEGDPNCVDQKGMTPLHMSAWAGKDGPVKALLENRALPNLPSHSGDTPLHLAAQHGYAGCTKVLLTFHADGSFRNDNKETPLDLACQYGHTGVVKQLITDDKVKTLLMTPMTDQRYKSPLHLSAKSGHDDIAHLLIQGGANVNDKRVEGTPLHQAALYGKTDVVRLLLRAGADASVKNSHGLMALDLVNRFTTSRAGLEIKQMLREAAGDRVAYARAVSDYNNQFDDTSLTFKVGDTIAVIEQNEDGRWKGYVVNSEAEKVGYFPAMVVQLISKSKKTRSLCSTGSQASVESELSGNGSSSYAPSTNSSPEKHSDGPGSPTLQPVGIVPIGSYEVVTLAQANPDSHGNPKQTANGSFPPRMSSFKQKKNVPQQSSLKTPQRNSDHIRNSTPMSQPCHINNNEQSKTAYHMQRSKSEDRSRVKIDANNQHNNIDPNVLKRLSPMTSPGHSPTLRSRAAQHEFIQNLRQQQQHQIQQQQLLTQQLQHDFSTLKRPDKEKPTIYADVEVVSGKLQNGKSPPSHISNYNTTYFDQVDGNKHRNNSSTPSITDNESVTSSNASCDNKLLSTPTIKPILVKSKSNDSYNKTPSVSDTEGSIRNGYSVKFANSSPEEIRRERMYSYEPTMSMYSDENSYNHNDRPVYHRSNSEGFGDYNQQNDMSNNCFTLKRPKKKVDGRHHEHDMIPFPIAFPPPPPLSNGSGSISPSHNGSPKSLHPSGSPQMRESWSSSKTSESNSPKLSGSPLSINRLSDSSYSPRIDSSLSPRTPVFEDDMRFPPSNEQLDEDDQKVLDWLIDLKLASYFYSFQLHGFDMISIRAITPEDLNIMDIKKTGHRKKLLSEIAKLPPATELPKMKPDDVGSWLARLNLDQYEANFIEGGFDDIDFLKDLDKNDLDMIDIKKKGHQKKILMAVQQLSDLELTAILDEVVAETPVRRGLSVNGRNYSDQILQEFFPSNFPNIVIASSAQNSTAHGLYNSTPGGGTAMEQTTITQRSPPAPAARPSVPPPVLQKNPNIIAPKPKPKPKPARSNGTTNGYHHRGSSNESLNDSGPLGNGSLNSSGEIQGDQDEVVTSSKSRIDGFDMSGVVAPGTQDLFEKAILNIIRLIDDIFIDEVAMVCCISDSNTIAKEYLVKRLQEDQRFIRDKIRDLVTSLEANLKYKTGSFIELIDVQTIESKLEEKIIVLSDDENEVFYPPLSEAEKYSICSNVDDPFKEFKESANKEQQQPDIEDAFVNFEETEEERDDGSSCQSSVSDGGLLQEADLTIFNQPSQTYNKLTSYWKILDTQPRLNERNNFANAASQSNRFKSTFGRFVSKKKKKQDGEGKGKDFFKEQERKASVNSQDGFERKPSLTSLSSFDGSPSNTIKRNGTKPTPSLKPKPILPIPENQNGVGPHSPKPPPPAPPKRSDSIKNGIDTEQLNMIYNDEAPALPVKSKSRSSESDTPTTSNNSYPSPPVGFASPIREAAPEPPPPAKVNNLPPHSTTEFHEEYENNISNKPLEKKKDAIDDAFGSTDDLLNDLMADINDFSAQLDAMF